MSTPTSDERSPRRRILVVDDDPSEREALARVLRRDSHGYQVEVAADGLEAGVKLSRFRPHLVVLDLVMPGMGGFDVCARIRAHSDMDEMKIIVLTGYPGGDVPERSLLHGADLFLTKPQDVSALRAHVAELLEA